MNLITKKSDARGALRNAGWKDKDILDVIPLEIPAATPATASEHDKTCICMYCKPELWPDDSEENKYRDLAAERWNQLEEERNRLDAITENGWDLWPSRNHWNCGDMDCKENTGKGKTPREAIDDAIKREET